MRHDRDLVASRPRSMVAAALGRGDARAPVVLMHPEPFAAFAAIVAGLDALFDDVARALARRARDCLIEDVREFLALVINRDGTARANGSEHVGRHADTQRGLLPVQASQISMPATPDHHAVGQRVRLTTVPNQVRSPFRSTVRLGPRNGGREPGRRDGQLSPACWPCSALSAPPTTPNSDSSRCSSGRDRVTRTRRREAGNLLRRGRHWLSRRLRRGMGTADRRADGAQ